MCGHASILMLAATELKDGILRGTAFTGLYTCRTCQAQCQLSVTHQDASRVITIVNRDVSGDIVVYTVIDGAMIRIR